MKCDELKATEVYARFATEVYDDFGDVRQGQEYYRKEHVDAAIEEFKTVVFTDNSAVIARLEAELRKTQRTLWLARAERASAWHTHFALCHNHSIHSQFCINGSSLPTEHMTTMRTPAEWCAIWKRIHNKLISKAKEFV